MIKLKRTDAKDADFINLVKALDAYLAITDGAEHEFYDQYNQLTDIKYVVLAYEDEVPVACGAIKQFEAVKMEVKRMFTREAYRGRGVAGQVLTELEAWSAALGHSHCVLECGLRQEEAMAFYVKSGYKFAPSYGQYIGMDNSQCFIKKLA